MGRAEGPARELRQAPDEAAGYAAPRVAYVKQHAEMARRG